MKEKLNEIITENGFIKHNNIEIIEVKQDTATLKATLDENSLNPYKIAHGGLIFGLGDTAMGVVARATGKKAVTLSANITYLKPSTGKYLIAKSEIIKDGTSTCYLRTNIYNDENTLVATMDANYFYIN